MLSAWWRKYRPCRAAGKINDFVSFIQGLKSKAEAYTVRETLEEVIELTGYVKELEAEKTEEAQARIENIDELISKTESSRKPWRRPDSGNTFCISGGDRTGGRYRFC